MTLTVICLSVNTVAAQNESLVNESYSDKSVGFILSDIQQKYGSAIYYKAEWFGDTRLSLNIENRTLPEALNYILKDQNVSVEKLLGNVFIVFSNDQNGTRNYNITLSGVVLDGNSSEPVPNAIIRIPELEVATISDLDGNYSFEFKAGTYLITAKSVNADLSREVKQFYEDQRHDITIFERVIELDDVVITGRSQDENISNSNPGKVSFTLESIRKLPSLMGETDISRIILSLPGVQTVGEGASGFNVRGGAIDQNLILMDGVPIYNSAHLLGFFSIFNPDLVNDFTVYKGNIPAQYGGKLSSVVSVDIKNPQANKVQVSGGIGPVSNKAFINIPMVENKLSVLVGGRYSDPTWILKSVDDLDVQKSSANFNDFNIKTMYAPSEKDNFTASAYRSYDFYDFGSDTAFNYVSKSLSFSWDHQLGSGFFSRLSGYHSIYEAELNDKSQFRQFNYNNGISATGAKLSFDYNKTERFHYSLGAEIKSSEFKLGEINPANSESSILTRNLGIGKSMEFALFAENKFKVSNRLEIVSGLIYLNSTRLNPDQSSIFLIL
jgi:hypothetical protein